MPGMMVLLSPCWEATKGVSPTFAFTPMATSSSQEPERYWSEPKAYGLAEVDVICYERDSGRLSWRQERERE